MCVIRIPAPNNGGYRLNIKRGYRFKRRLITELSSARVLSSGCHSRCVSSRDTKAEIGRKTMSHSEMVLGRAPLQPHLRVLQIWVLAPRDEGLALQSAAGIVRRSLLAGGSMFNTLETNWLSVPPRCPSTRCFSEV